MAVIKIFFARASLSSPWLLNANRGTVLGPNPAGAGSWCQRAGAVPFLGPWPTHTAGSKELNHTTEWKESKEWQIADVPAASRSHTTTAAAQTSANYGMLYSTPAGGKNINTLFRCKLLFRQWISTKLYIYRQKRIFVLPSWQWGHKCNFVARSFVPPDEEDYRLRPLHWALHKQTSQAQKHTYRLKGELQASSVSVNPQCTLPYLCHVGLNHWSQVL